VTGRPFNARRLLKLYPPSWRERYGDEFVTYVDDALDGDRPTAGFVLSIITGALRERGHHSGLVGADHAPSVQSRAGALLVLCAWSAFMFAGASFSKLSEHSASAMPAGSGSLAHVGFVIVASCGALGMVLVLLGACVTLPSFTRFLRDGGWPLVRQRIRTSLALSALLALFIVPLTLWAHHLNSLQRNGGDAQYSGAFVVWVALCALTFVSWDRVAVQCVSQMTLPPRVLRFEALLAGVISLLMIAITVGAALWWADVATNAPWFLQGASAGTSSSPFAPNLFVTLVLMVLATGVGAFGTSRIARAWRRA
jgi:hypothetical protein